MHTFHHFRPVGDDCELQTQEGRAIEQFLAEGFKVEAYLPGYTGDASSVAIVFSKG